MSGALEEMPLFPLPVVVFPYAQLQIRVAEPSLLDLVNYCNDQDRCFGAVLARESDPGARAEPYFVGTAVRIDRVIPSDDGSVDVVVRGQRRFRVRRLDEDSHSFLLGHVEPIVEMEIENEERADALTYRLKEVFEEYIKAELRDSDIKFHGIKLPTDPTALSFMAANLLRIEDIEKQRLLETTDTVERLATILPLIQSQIESRRPSGYYRATSDMLREWVTPN